MHVRDAKAGKASNLPGQKGMGGGPPQGAREGRPLISREDFAKIGEVEGIRLSDEAKRVLEELDRKDLTREERRQAIIARFKRDAAE